MRRVVLVAPLVLTSCIEPEQERPEGWVRDQSGAEFILKRTVNWWEIHRLAGVSPRAPDYGDEGVGTFDVMFTRFPTIHWRDPAGDMVAYSFRILVCEQDEDCPQDDWTRETFGCFDGYCRDATDEGVGTFDFFNFCMGPTPRAIGQEPEQWVWDEMDARCQDNSCESLPPRCIE